MPYHYWFLLLDSVGIIWFNDSLLITRDILSSQSLHQPLISNHESYIGIVIIFITLSYCILIPSIAMTLANFIDIYIFGLLFIIGLLSTYISIVGLLFISHWVLLFISSVSSFILFLSIIEYASIILQSITITNRLSINIIAGGLLVNILLLCLDLSVMIDYWLWIDYRVYSSLSLSLLIFDFEILSLFNQSFIFIILLFVIIH